MLGKYIGKYLYILNITIHNDHKINLYFKKKNCLLNFHCLTHSALMRFFKILLKPALVSCDSPGVTHYGIPCNPILYYTMAHAIHHLRSGYQNVSSSRLFWIHNLFCGFFSTSTSTIRGGDSLHWRERVDWVT